MKEILFTKMSGAGNDFIVVESPRGIKVKTLGRSACHRTDGIGADGLIVVGPSSKADYRMRIINADGSEAEMCGNGARCAAAYIFKNKTSRNAIALETLAGIIHAKKVGKLICVGLSNPKDYTKNIAVSVNNRTLHLQFINTGVPHAVCFVNGLEKIDVNAIGRIIRYHKRFAPKGTNVNFVEQKSADLINIRTYERGVESETRACGTGSVASAIIAYLQSNPDVSSKRNAAMNVKTKNGEVLKIKFDFNKTKASNVQLTGSANFIAQGKFFLKS